MQLELEDRESAAQATPHSRGEATSYFMRSSSVSSNSSESPARFSTCCSEPPPLADVDSQHTGQPAPLQLVTGTSRTRLYIPPPPTNPQPPLSPLHCLRVARSRSHHNPWWCRRRNVSAHSAATSCVSWSLQLLSRTKTTRRASAGGVACQGPRSTSAPGPTHIVCTGTGRSHGADVGDVCNRRSRDHGGGRLRQASHGARDAARATAAAYRMHDRVGVHVLGGRRASACGKGVRALPAAYAVAWTRPRPSATTVVIQFVEMCRPSLTLLFGDFVRPLGCGLWARLFANALPELEVCMYALINGPFPSQSAIATETATAPANWPL